MSDVAAVLEHQAAAAARPAPVRRRPFTYWCCNFCGHAHKSREIAPSCPSCRAGAEWGTPYAYSEHASAHKPWCKHDPTFASLVGDWTPGQPIPAAWAHKPKEAATRGA